MNAHEILTHYRDFWYDIIKPATDAYDGVRCTDVDFNPARILLKISDPGGSFRIMWGGEEPGWGVNHADIDHTTGPSWDIFEAFDDALRQALYLRAQSTEDDLEEAIEEAQDAIDTFEDYDLRRPAPLVLRYWNDAEVVRTKAGVVTSEKDGHLGIGLGDGHRYVLERDRGGIYRDRHDKEARRLNPTGWADEILALDLDVERRVPKEGEWYIDDDHLFVRCQDDAWWCAHTGDVHRPSAHTTSPGVPYIQHAVITEDMNPYLFREEGT